MTIKIDFNADMGESFGPYKLGFDEELIKYIVSSFSSLFEENYHEI